MLTPSRATLSAAVVFGCLTVGCAGRASSPATPAPSTVVVRTNPVPATPQPLTPEPEPAPEPIAHVDPTPAPQPEPAAQPAVQVAEQKPDPAPVFAEQKTEPAAVDEILAITTVGAPIATPQTTATVSQDLKQTVYDIDIPLNAKVLSYVQLFSGRLQGYLEEGLSRGVQYLPMIQSVFRAEGLPLDLAYIPLIESAFKPNALSRAKAKGIWQFMRGTGLENGLKSDWYVDERSDPEKATYAAARYLKTLHKMFDGDWHLALAAYNGGPGRVQRAIKRSGRRDYWKLTATSRYLPRETRDYVPLILAAVIVARNPAQYGLTVTPPPMPAYEKVLVNGPVDVRRIAEWAGVALEVIQELNPELRRWTTPLRSSEYEIKVPEGTAEPVMAGLRATAPEQLASFSYHAVKKGETIATIAKKLKVTRADLAEANYLSTKARLQTGQQLVVPRAPTTILAAPTTVLAAAQAATPAPAAVSEARQPDVVLAGGSVAERSERATEERKLVHRVKRGETLTSIARLYRTTISALKEWNRIQGNVIQAGQRLTIYTPRTVATN